ncbi:putative 25.3 kDa vesicle transport protein [Blattamonas nauphoetae]|uniref:25.3 kDa vesicle transport protein n=1 Tax=Blattamonas nauphoetae TaxID=2049346 RepID=A0ABQ9XXB7_9EUKA|nr:putative 25.3 kDa vesicle transport protein [Blattamonas nauphoetae]
MSIVTTLISRLSDGLILAGSMMDVQTFDIEPLKQKAKQIVKKLTLSSDPRCTIQDGQFVFCYVIDRNVVFLAICTASFPSSTIYKYLDDVSQDFLRLHGQNVDTVIRPYAFVSFDMEMEKKRRRYADSLQQNKIDELNAELNDVREIMTKNIDDVIGRGERIDVVTDISQTLLDDSRTFHRNSSRLNENTFLRKALPYSVVVGSIVLALVFKKLQGASWLSHNTNNTQRDKEETEHILSLQALFQRYTRFSLPDTDIQWLANQLTSLTFSRAQIRSIMVFVLDRSEFAGQLIQIIISAMHPSSFKTPPHPLASFQTPSTPHITALLYLLSDIFSNSTQPLPPHAANASERPSHALSVFHTLLIDVFPIIIRWLDERRVLVKGRSTAARFEDSVERVMIMWEKHGLMTRDAMTGLKMEWKKTEETKLKKLRLKELLNIWKQSKVTSNPDPALYSQFLVDALQSTLDLTSDALLDKCRAWGISSVGPKAKIQIRVALAWSIREEQKQKDSETREREENSKEWSRWRNRQLLSEGAGEWREDHTTLHELSGATQNAIGTRSSKSETQIIRQMEREWNTFLSEEEKMKWFVSGVRRPVIEERNDLDDVGGTWKLSKDVETSKNDDSDMMIDEDEHQEPINDGGWKAPVSEQKKPNPPKKKFGGIKINFMKK